MRKERHRSLRVYTRSYHDAAPVQTLDMVEPGIIEDHDHASVLVNDVLHLIQEDLEQSLVAVAGDESEETTVFGTYRTHDIDMQPSAPAGDGGVRTPRGHN